MITKEEFEKIQKDIMEEVFSLMLNDGCNLFDKVTEEYYCKAVENISLERGLSLRVFKDPVNNDLYLSVGNYIDE